MMLLRQPWHETPLVVDVGHLVFADELRIAFSQEPRIPHLDRIAKVSGKRAQERIDREKNSSAGRPCRWNSKRKGPVWQRKLASRYGFNTKSMKDPGSRNRGFPLPAFTP